jgi:mannan endo-1,4-beta-mannosidase
MRSRLTVIIAVAVALAALGFTINRVISAPGKPLAVHAKLPPMQASYLGVFEHGAPPDYQPLNIFGKLAGMPPNLVGYFSGWAEPFDRAFANSVSAHGAVLLVQIDPTYAPIAQIAAGAYDGYLRSYADSVRRYGRPVVIGFGQEMNGTWYPWGYNHVSPATFAAAWRHLVTVFRGQGADNVTWLWTINANRPTDSTVPPLSSWWPGRRYVTWIGIDGFYYRSSDTFRSVFGKTIEQARALTQKPMPVLLSETAVGPAAEQFIKIPLLFSGMVQYKTLGLVWFDENQHDGIYHQNWRIEGNQNAAQAFRFGVSGHVRR